LHAESFQSFAVGNMRREIAALAAVLVLGVGGYYGYDAYLGTLPKTIVKVKPVWFSLEDPRGKTFDWVQHDTDCIFVKVKAVAPPSVYRGLGDTTSDPSLQDQLLLVVDTLGQNYLDKPESNDPYAPLVKADGHVIEVGFAGRYTYPGSIIDPKARQGWVDVFRHQEQGIFEIADRHRRNVKLRVIGQGEAPQVDQASYACLWENIYSPENSDGATPHVAHWILTHFEIIE
jgi:hypothetical protein